MNISTKITVATLVAGAFSLTAGAFSGALAQSAPPVNGWYKVCSKQEDNDICNVQFQSVANNGQVVTAVSLAEIKGKINRKVFQITVPSGRFIPAGIKVRVDDKKEASLPYAYCFPQSCMAEVQLDDNLIALLKSGGGMTITSSNFQNKENPVQVTLEGFTAAYDGPALKQDELQAKQRELQEELRKKAEEQRKKLQEEQEKAKAGAAN
ncbi:MAG: invasion associated locus B family protein [Rhizobiaceae bacterium]